MWVVTLAVGGRTSKFTPLLLLLIEDDGAGPVPPQSMLVKNSYVVYTLPFPRAYAEIQRKQHKTLLSKEGRNTQDSTRTKERSEENIYLRRDLRPLCWEQPWPFPSSLWKPGQGGRASLLPINGKGRISAQNRAENETQSWRCGTVGSEHLLTAAVTSLLSESFKATWETSTENWNEKLPPQLSLTRHLAPGLWEKEVFHQASERRGEQLASPPAPVVNEDSARECAQRSQDLPSFRELCFGRCQKKQLENCGWEYS